MTWTGQMLHVAGKDLRRLRWLLLGYLVVVAFAVLRATLWVGSDLQVSAPVLIMLLALCVAALAVQADDPVRVDAFWATLPLERSAVTAAKVVLLLGLIAVGALAQTLVLLLYDLPGGLLLRMTADATLMLTLALGFIALASAATADIRTLVISAVAALVAFVLALGAITIRRIGQSQFPASLTTIDWHSPPWSLLVVLLVFALLFQQYRHRFIPAGLIAGMTILLLGLTAMNLFEPHLAPRYVADAHYAARRAAKLPGAVAPERVGVVDMRISQLTPPLRGAQVTFEVRVDGKALSPRFDLTAAQVMIAADGREYATSASSRPANNSRMPPSSTRFTAVTVTLTPAQLTALQRPRASVRIRGWGVATTDTVPLRLPLRPGAAGTFGGHRVRIAAAPAAGEQWFPITQVSVVGANGALRGSEPQVTYSLAHGNRSATLHSWEIEGTLESNVLSSSRLWVQQRGLQFARGGVPFEGAHLLVHFWHTAGTWEAEFPVDSAVLAGAFHYLRL